MTRDHMKDVVVSFAKRKWTQRIGTGVLVVFLWYMIVGFIGVPLVLRHVVLAKVNEKLVGTMEVGNFDFNPFTWELKIEDFEGLTSDGEVAASFAQFRVNVQPSSIFGDAYVVREVLWDQPKCTLNVDREGRVNLASLFGLNEDAVEVDKEDSGPFVIPSLVIETLAVRDAGFRIRLEGFDPPFERVIDNLSLEMNDIRTLASHDNPYRFALVTAEDEQLEIDGSLRLDPLSSVGTVTMKSLKLESFTSFGTTLMNAEIDRGILDLNFDYRFRPLAAQPELGLKNGSLALREFRLVKPGSDRLIHGVAALRVDGFYLNVMDQSTGLESLSIDGASIQLVRDRAGRLQWLEKASTRRSPRGSSKGQVDRGPSRKAAAVEVGVIADDRDIGVAISEASAKMRTLSRRESDSGEGTDFLAITLGQCVINNSRIRFRDESVSPRASFALADIELSAGPYASTGAQPLDVELSLNLADGAAGGIGIKGSMLPMEPFRSTRFGATVDGVTMSSFAGYLVSATGQPTTSGKLNATLHYQIAKGLIEGSNELALERMEFGPRAEESDAPRLPLKLAVAILQDANGVIKIDIPVSGDVQDPNFSYGAMTSLAIRNVIQKVVTAPMEVLSGLLPNRQSGAGMSSIEFDRGESSLSKGAEATLEEFAKIMKARPGLALKLKPSYSIRESRALSELRFERSVAKWVDKGMSREDAIEELHDDLPRKQRVSILGFADSKKMEQAVRNSLTATEGDLRELAEERGRVVLEWLKSEGGIKKSRIELVSPPKRGSAKLRFAFDVYQK